jgi:hypothetical protein
MDSNTIGHPNHTLISSKSLVSKALTPKRLHIIGV